MFRRDSQQTKPAPEPRPQHEVSTPAAPPAEPATPALATPQPAIATPQPAPAPTNLSFVASGDVFEGKLTTTNGVRVLGTVRGSIESRSNVQVDGDALVEADITAENVTIAGTYKGNLNCSGRLEITSTGKASGELETGRILLHEGGYFEGSLHMKPPQAETPATTTTETTRRRYGGNS